MSQDTQIAEFIAENIQEGDEEKANLLAEMIVAMQPEEKPQPTKVLEFKDAETFNQYLKAMSYTLKKSVEKAAHKFSSTQFNLSDAGYSRNPYNIEILQEMLLGIDDNDLVEDGKEDEFHITVKYGIHSSDPEVVRNLVENFGPVKVTLGSTSLFPANENDSQRGGAEYDVVKIDVHSDDLVRLNGVISYGTPVTDTHPKYQPHITLAYVKPGLGKKYIEMDDVKDLQLSFDKLVFSDADGKITIIDLSKPSIVKRKRSPKKAKA